MTCDDWITSTLKQWGREEYARREEEKIWLKNVYERHNARRQREREAGLARWQARRLTHIARREMGESGI